MTRFKCDFLCSFKEKEVIVLGNTGSFSCVQEGAVHMIELPLTAFNLVSPVNGVIFQSFALSHVGNAKPKSKPAQTLQKISPHRTLYAQRKTEAS